jgi:predicted dehydrogenase
MRDLFADSSVDAVAIAAPNHWHALATIWACQAGKDVYVEKPACHEPWEGAQMVAAARKYRRIVQVGTQSRSQGHKIEAVRRLREGAIGKVYLVKGVCFKRRPSIGRTPEAAVPPGLDWDLFLGPAPVRAFTANRFKYNWHWFWDTGNGDIANQGAHEMDIARWGLGRDGYPQSVFSTGGKFAYDDDQETPNTQVAALDYGDAQILFEVRGLPAVPEENVRIGNLFYGSEGLMALDVYGFRIYRGDGNHKILDEKYREPKPWATGPHVENFLRAVRSRNPADLTAPVETGVLSANLSHLANISYRTGRKLSIDSPLGIAGDAGAQHLLRREYRKPYVVPEVV